MTLVNEIKTTKRKSKIVKAILLMVIFGIGYFVYLNFIQVKNIEPEITKKTFNVKKSDLKTYIESDGKIGLKDDFNLNFLSNGIIKKIYKNEGDSIEKGELIAELDDTYLKLDIEKAKLALENAKANYEIKKRGTTESEINIQEKQVDANKNSLDNQISQNKIDLDTVIYNKQILNDSLNNIEKQNEINLLNSKNNLDTAKIDLDTAEKNLKTTTNIENEKYLNAQNKLLMEAGQLISIIEKNLFDIDILLGVSDENKDLNDSYQDFLGTKNSIIYTQAKDNYKETKKSFYLFYTEWREYRKTTDLTQIYTYTEKLRNIGGATNKTINYTIDVLKNSISSVNFSQITIDNYITNFEKTLSENKDITAGFSNLIQTTLESKSSMDEKINIANNQVIASEQKYKIAQANYDKTILENDISISLAKQKLEQADTQIETTKIKNNTLISKEVTNLDISKTILDSKKQVDDLDLSTFITSIKLAEKNLEEAQKKLEDSKIFSPISGKIVDISGKVGESTSLLKTPFVTIINPNAMYVESFIEESDILKIKNNQDVYIFLDSIDTLVLNGKVIYINDKANIDSNGLVTYETKILFEVTDNRVKDGMTSTIQFITKEVKNVLVIPVQAVKTINKKPSVTIENGEYKEVITGFTDGKMVEVISGLNLGDKVIY